MKKIFLVIISLLTFFITFNSVKALSCYYENSECKHYYFRYSQNEVSHDFELEIGQKDNGEKYAIINESDTNVKEELKPVGNTYTNPYPTNLSKTFTCPKDLLDNIPNKIMYSTLGDESTYIIKFSVAENDGDNVATGISGGNDNSNGNTTVGECYFDDSTYCKRYWNLFDGDGKPFALEIGTRSSLGSYYIVSYDQFANLYGEENAQVGTANTYIYETGHHSFKIDNASILTNYPDNLGVTATGSHGSYVHKIYNERTGHYFDSSTGDNVGYTDMDCYGLLGSTSDPNDPAYWLQKALQVIRYAGIVALFVLSTVDFVKAIVNQDNDALKKAINTTVKRFIYAVLIFFIPMLTESILKFFGVYGTCAL